MSRAIYWPQCLIEGQDVSGVSVQMGLFIFDLEFNYRWTFSSAEQVRFNSKLFCDSFCFTNTLASNIKCTRKVMLLYCIILLWWVLELSMDVMVQSMLFVFLLDVISCALIESRKFVHRKYCHFRCIQILITLET